MKVEAKPMETLHFTIDINAPKEKVWNTMLGEETSRVWTDVFDPDSYFVGDWSEGSKLLYLVPDETGELGGVVSRIRKNRPHEAISIEHIGIVEDGIEYTSNAEAKKWAGARETYTFTERDGSTKVGVKVDATDEAKEMFQNNWPKALEKLKELAEG